MFKKNIYYFSCLECSFTTAILIVLFHQKFQINLMSLGPAFFTYTPIKPIKQANRITLPMKKNGVFTNRPIKCHIFLNQCSSLILKSPAESPICGPAFFTCVPTRSARLAFICEKNVLEKSKSPLILFYYKRKIKQKIKP